MGIDDIILNSDYKNCKLIFTQLCHPKNKHKIICSLLHLKFNRYQWTNLINLKKAITPKRITRFFCRTENMTEIIVPAESNELASIKKRG
jgi:hypothetical protein